MEHPEKVFYAKDERMDLLCKSIHHVSGISFFLFDEELNLCSALSHMTEPLKDFFFLNCPLDLKKLARSTDADPCFYTDSLHLNWFILPLPGETSLIMLGPVFEMDISFAYFYKKLDFQQLSIQARSRFSTIMKEIPVVQYLQFFQYYSMVYYGFCGSVPEMDTVRKYQQQEAPAPSKKSGHHRRGRVEPDIPTSHGSRLAERIMLENVRNGSMASPMSFAQKHSYVKGTLSHGDPLRQAQNESIIMTSLVARAAIEGGMDPEESYTLSDTFILEAELCTSQEAALTVTAKMYQTYIQGVARVRMQRYHPAVSFTCTYIDKHLNEVISLDEIARELGYETYYLTNLFKKDTGKTIKAYILEKKLSLAKIMLETTMMDIREISDHLAFSSSSYFCTQFKNSVGETPRSYRLRMTSGKAQQA